MRYFLHPAVDAELRAAIEFFDSRRFGLGGELADEVNRTIQHVCEFPKVWPFLEKTSDAVWSIASLTALSTAKNPTISK